MEILFLAHRAPFPPDRGDRIRSWHVLRYLAARARVHLVALDEDPAPPPPELATTLASCTVIPRRRSRARASVAALASGRPVSLAAFDEPRVAARVAELIATWPIAATYVFSGQMAQYVAPGRPSTILDLVDVDSAKFAQMGRAGGPLGWLFAREARLLGRVERAAAAAAAATLLVSEPEAALFRAGGATGRILAVENGIDAARFDPSLSYPRPNAAAEIVFTGQMDYAPNVEAATWFVREVLPLIRARHPDARFAIVGRAPTAAVRRLASDSVVVTGAVEDTRPWLEGARVAVAPLRLARGIQNKVLEAMAMATPVVATAAAAEGIDHGGTVRIADDATGIANAVASLVADPVRAAAAGQAARARVIARYDWAARLRPLDALLSLPDVLGAAA